MCACRYPVGICQVIEGGAIKWPEEGKKWYFGIVRARVLPPKDLLHPLLTYTVKRTGKLCFTLCARCANEQTDVCTCTDEQRSFYWAGFTEELLEAIRLGYTVMVSCQIA